jgi:cytochrome oxidase Cu insertion factor (SCO1/SenC/PrrC family)
MALATALALIVASTARSLSKLEARPEGEPRSEAQPGLQVGAMAPKFSLRDQEGKDRSLDEILKQGKVALVFYRSADW